MSDAPSRLPDRLGIGVSTLCLVHCLIGPVLVALGLAWVGFEGVHVALLLLVVPVAVWAGVHAGPRARMLLGAGCLLLVAALGLEPVWGKGGEVVLTVAGGVLLVAGHLLNLRRCRVRPRVAAAAAARP